MTAPLTLDVEVQLIAERLVRQSFDLRYGQALFNALCTIRPDIANQITGTSVDPFYNDDLASAFLARLSEWTVGQ